MPKPTVVFVCEHGAAKSVIAREHFLRFANDRDLDVDAIARGTNPDPEISPSTRRGLAADGFELDCSSPRALGIDDVGSAIMVISFDTDVRAFVGHTVQNEKWNDLPPAKDDYANGKLAIIARVRELVDRISKEST